MSKRWVIKCFVSHTTRRHTYAYTHPHSLCQYWFSEVVNHAFWTAKRHIGHTFDLIWWCFIDFHLFIMSIMEFIVHYFAHAHTIHIFSLCALFESSTERNRHYDWESIENMNTIIIHYMAFERYRMLKSWIWSKC